MNERDWEKELAKIDAQIRSLPDEEEAPVQPAALPRKAALPGVAKPSGSPPAVAAAPAAPRTSRVGAFLRLGLAGALAVGMAFWPFDARCGVGLAAYLFSATMVVVAGGWSAVWTWRHRTPRAHVIALAIALWGMVLASMEILPRAGYGPATLDRPRIWSCG